jgi:mono/diheme cytochrome c family protein
MHVLAAVLAASLARSVGLVIFFVALGGFIVYAVINIRSGRDEVGSEIELAPNRKPYYSDEELEGPKLDRTLLWGAITLGITAVALPIYWLNEPGRMDGAIVEFERVFATRGEALFATTEEGGFNCAGCHGAEGVGGQAAHTITDADGEFVASVQWRAPALNTVMLRYSREEVTYILTYGRPFSPMPAWGLDGGGPMNDQQLKNLVDYMASITISPEDAREAIEDELREQLDLGEDAEIDYEDEAVGEALFNMGRENGFAGGAYSCGRCHTRGWSIVDQPDADPPSPNPPDADLSEYTGYPDGSGAMGPRLVRVIPRQFLTVAEMVEFISAGSVDGARYGQNGQGSGRMPGFGDNPNTEEIEADGMVSQDMICAIVRYEASLGEGEDPGGPCVVEEEAAT